MASLFQAPFSSGRNESDQRDKSREELKTRIKISRSFLSGYESYNRQLPSADSIVSRPQAKLDIDITISIDLNVESLIDLCSRDKSLISLIIRGSTRQ